jgi:hypothetical protein
LTVADRKTIQRFPSGVLAMLGMQTSGDTPQTMAQEVGLSLEATDYYLLDRLENKQAGPTNVGLAPGTFSGALTPSAGEVWLVYWASAQLTQPAATTGRYRLMLFAGSRSPNILMGFGEPSVTAAAGDFVNVGYHFERPAILLPGDVFGIIAETYTGAVQASMFAQARFVRLAV